MNEGVIHFSTNDGGGGAFTAAYRIHKFTQKLGFKSILFVQNRTREDESVIEVGKNRKNSLIFRVWTRIFRNREAKDSNLYYYYDRMNYSLTCSSDVIKALPFTPKVIFIHWISGFLDTDVVIDLYKKFGAVVYFTFMDTAPLTGGCHFSWDCLGYTHDCSNCPAVPLTQREIPIRNLEKKIRFLRAVPAIPLSSNSWMNEKIMKSRLFGGAEIRKLSIGIDSDVFCPGLKRQARERLGIPKDKKYILVAASYLEDPRKGVQYAKLAVSHLVNKLDCDLDVVEVLLAGVPGRFARNEEWDLPVTCVGTLSGDYALVDLYRSADIFLFPSIEDASPMMVSESMLCGTPVASFDVGSACDLIKHKESGFIVPSKDYKALAVSLSFFLRLDTFSVDLISINARRSAIQYSSLQSEEKNLLSLIKENIDEKI